MGRIKVVTVCYCFSARSASERKLMVVSTRFEHSFEETTQEGTLSYNSFPTAVLTVVVKSSWLNLITHQLHFPQLTN